VMPQPQRVRSVLSGSRWHGTRRPAQGGTTMLLEHQHKPGVFDPGHRRASWALGSAGVGILLALVGRQVG
jgi:hypothetical protein